MSARSPALFSAAALTAILALAIWAYWPGLPGPFLFDDATNISKNTQVHISDLSPRSLSQAWNSSHLAGTGSRPLAQLSFGINHALAGLDTSSYKATNLTIHLLAGLLIFALARRLTQVLARNNPAYNTHWPALLTTALWLLHPLNLTPVLYVVQRMTSLSALFVLAALWCHISGRLRMADGNSRGFWLAFIGLPLAAIGGMAKESAALYPLLVLALEWTLLRDFKAPGRTVLLAMVGWLPLLLGTAYLLTHPGFLNYSGRDFTLEERLLTQARVLWQYLGMLALPDLSTFGLYHDDLTTSRSLLTPWTTLPAVLSWLILIPASLLLARRWPVASFALLFFLAGHGMESTIFPLELVFEHRNYLAIFAPLFALSWVLTNWGSAQKRVPLAGLSVTLVILFAAVTHLRAQEWASLESFIISEVKHHPDSPRANFDAAKMLIGYPSESEDAQASYLSARYYLEKTRRLVPDHLDSLFGLIVLNLHYGRDPETEWIDALNQGLRTGVVDATKLTTSQFSFLVRWHMSPTTHKLPSDMIIGLFESALANPKHNSYGRSGILSALRAYYDLVLKQPERALDYAREAANVWPQRWHYQKRYVELLVKLGHTGEARKALQMARHYDTEGQHLEDAERLTDLINAARKDADNQ